MRISILISIVFFLLVILSPALSLAQCNTIQGSFTVLAGQTKNYSYCYNSQTFVSPVWTVTKGVVLSTSLSPDGTTANATVRWDVKGTGSLVLRDGAVLQTKSITINCGVLEDATFSPASPYVCGSGTAIISGSPGDGGNSVKYYSAATGGTALKTGGAYTTPTISTTTPYYIATYHSTSTCESSSRVVATGAVNTVPNVPATTSPGTACYNGTTVLGATPGANGTEIRWFDASTNGNLTGTGNSFTTPVLTSTTAFYAATYTADGKCYSARTPVDATVKAMVGTPVSVTPGSTCSGSSATLSAAPGANGTQVKWFDALTNGNLLGTGNTFTTPAITTSQTFYAATYDVYDICYSTRVPVLATVNLNPGVPASTTPGFACYAGTAVLSATPGVNGTQIKWFDALTNGNLLSTGNSFTTPALTTNQTYYAATFDASGICSSARTAVQATVNPVVGIPATTTAGSTCYNGTAVLSATPGSNGTQIKWFDALTNGNLVGNGNSFTTPSLTVSRTYYAATYNTSGTCFSTRTAVVATVHAVPANAQGGVDDVIYGAGTMMITPTVGAGGNSIRWYDVETGGSSVFDGITFTTPTLSATKVYYISTLITAPNCESASRMPVVVTVIPVVSPSSVKQEVIRTSGILQDHQIGTLNNAQKTTQLSYMDGLMRSHQQVIQAASPAGNDIVQPVEFDSYGRTSKSYLPYVAGSTTGAYKSTYKSDQLAFYNNAADKVADDSKPYAVSRFERSPMGRVLEQGSVGTAWQPGTGHTQKIKYSYNTGSTNSEAEEVRLLKSDGSSTAFYGANLLERTEGSDEDGNNQIVFTDKAGRVIVKKQQLDEVIDGVTVNYLQTYYVYDDFDRVKYIISPKGVAALKSGGWALTQSILDQYVHQFVYDARGRLIEKKVPGQAWMYYAYDELNRVVLTQDGLLKASNKWMFVKYDSKGRTTMQGIYLNATQNTRATIQALLDGLYTSTNPTYPESAYYESRGTALHGYTNTSFPKLNADNSALEIWNVLYYESHDFDFNGARDFKYDSLSFSGSGQAATSNWRARGLATGSKRLVLGTSTWLYTYVYYDKYNRTIQVRSNNHLSATVDNLATTVYDFEGKVLTTKNYHNAGGGKITTIINKYTYDNKGRLLKVHQNNNAAANDQLVAQYEYNELGQMVDKKLHETAVGNQTFLQSVDYRYTIRGQLNSINNAALNVSSATNDETNDFFGMEFVYNTLESGLSNTTYFNGNISAVKWKGAGAASGTADQKSYKFTYDKSNKLETATSQLYTGSAWTNEAGAINESMSYDHNGNIKSLQRNQRKHQLVGVVASYVSEQIDNLTYSYSTTIGDQLLKVEDAIAGTPGKAGFDNGTSAASNDYTYDVNGNLLTDQNKTITSNITYNVLGKPTLITYTDGRKLEYVYDASGSKIIMKMYAVGGALQTTTDYVGGFVYENSALSFFGSPEGRVVKNGSALEYQYAIADHQGNTRVVFTSATPAAQATPLVDFEAASNANVQNYPTGGNRSGWDLFNRTTPAPPNTYSHLLNGGNNSQVGVAKSYKVYPGDKVKIEAYAKYYNAQSTSVNLTTFATSLAGAFGVSSSSTGEALKAFNGLDSYGSIVAAGNGPGNISYPKLFVTILLYDKDYKFLDIAYEQIDGGLQSGISPKTAHDYMSREYTVKEAGYAYAYISNESPTYVEAYFDDVSFTYTPTNVVQYNEYYPFGLQTSNSWTRTNSTNNFLYNAANELNKTSGWYEMFFRGYDPTIGRMLQVDPYATLFSDHTGYNYAVNNPIMINDPSGGKAVQGPGEGIFIYGDMSTGEPSGPGSGNHWSDGIKYSDWTPGSGSQMYRDGLASGLVDIGGILREINSEGEVGREVRDNNGQLGYWEQNVYSEIIELDGVQMLGQVIENGFKVFGQTSRLGYEPSRDPFGALEYFLTGGIEDGIKYDRSGHPMYRINLGIAPDVSIGKAAKVSYTVYRAVAKDGRVYWGMTKNFAKRLAQHGERFLEKPIEMFKNIPTKGGAKGVEQLMIDASKGGLKNLDNIINSIGKNNPNLMNYYKEASRYLKGL